MAMAWKGGMGGVERRDGGSGKEGWGEWKGGMGEVERRDGGKGGWEMSLKKARISASDIYK